MKLEATFEITGWEQEQYDAPAGGPPLTRATMRKTFSGGLEGDHGRVGFDYEVK